MTATGFINVYKTSETCQLTGASMRQLDYWDRTGIARPSAVPARGSGSQRLWSDLDLPLLRLLVIVSGAMPKRHSLARMIRGVGLELDSAIRSASPAVVVMSGSNPAELVDLADLAAWIVQSVEATVVVPLAALRPIPGVAA